MPEKLPIAICQGCGDQAEILLSTGLCCDCSPPEKLEEYKKNKIIEV